jgi:hydrogenase nickel incorporation protein HypA/HybF
MHELPVAQNILAIGIRHAEKVKADRITRFNLVIGQFASVVDDSILFYWDLISKSTIAEGSTLVFTRLPAQFKCLNCGDEFGWDDLVAECPTCKSTKVKLLAGSEFYIESIEVE